MNYIAFIAGLPEISHDDRTPSMTLRAFREDGESYLNEQDSRLMELLLLTEDNRQVLKLLQKQGGDDTIETVYPLALLEEAVESPEDAPLPPYLRNFIIDFKSGKFEGESSAENILAERYFEALEHSGSEFVADYGRFKRNLKNLVAALNSRKFGKSISNEVVGEGDFAEELKSSQLKDFGLSNEYDWVERVTTLMSHSDLVERERGLDDVEWDYLDEALKFKYFSVEVLVAYLLKLKTLDRWSKMDSERGRKVFMELVDRFRSELTFDEQKKK